MKNVHGYNGVKINMLYLYKSAFGKRCRDGVNCVAVELTWIQLVGLLLSNYYSFFFLLFTIFAAVCCCILGEFIAVYVIL